MLPVISKIYEKIVHSQLYAFTEEFNVLSSSQFGFRKHKSTSHAIMKNLQYVYNNLDSGNIVISFFLDFQKAFDCVNHEILLRKLYLCGVRGVALRWFRGYLGGREQYIALDDTVSEVQPIECGIPQGSILGPLLFLIFINDFPQSSKFFDFTLFADDSTLSCKFNHSDCDLMTNVLISELSKVFSWLDRNKIKLNAHKSTYIIHSYRKRVSIPTISIGPIELKESDSTKFLGVKIDSSLNFQDHVSYIKTKLSKSMGILFKLKLFSL